MHPVVRVNRWMRTWWPLFVSTAAVALIVTLAWVGRVTIEERGKLDEQNDQLVALVERERIADAGRQARMDRAVSNVEALLIDHFALHDRNVAEKLNEMLAYIEGILASPTGSPPASMTAPHITASPPAAPTRTASPAPAPAAPKAPATTTTAPNQKSCTKRPNGPRC